MSRNSHRLIPILLSICLLLSASMACKLLTGSGGDDEPVSEGPADQPEAAAPEEPEAEEASVPPVTSGGEILFQEDFSSNARGWTEDNQSNDFGERNREVVDGKYRIEMRALDSYFWVITSVPDFRGKDYIFSIDATIEGISAAPGDYILQFSLREVDGVNGKHYSFQFYNDGTYDAEVWSSGSWESAVDILDNTSHPAIQLEPGVTNTFSFRVQDNSFTLYVNGEQLTSFTDATINEAGDVSINMGLDNANDTVTIEFDNLFIEALEGSPGVPDTSEEPAEPAEPAAPAETTPSCYKWDQITIDMAGEEVCVYGVAYSHQGQSRIDFSPEKNSFFLIDSTYYYPNLSEGACVVAQQKVEVFDGKIPFMTIKGDLYKCEPWMLE